VLAQNKQTNNMQHTTQHTPTTRFAASLFAFSSTSFRYLVAVFIFGFIIVSGYDSKGQYTPGGLDDPLYKEIHFFNLTNSDVNFKYIVTQDDCAQIGGGNVTVPPTGPTNPILEPIDWLTVPLTFDPNWKFRNITIYANDDLGSNDGNPPAGWSHNPSSNCNAGQFNVPANIGGTLYNITIADPVYFIFPNPNHRTLRVYIQ
jgi:hypothetical protein